jgi:hypothetical protein
MSKNKLLILFILRVLVFGLFVLSGILKLYPIQGFEKQLVDLGFVDWCSAPYVARLIIALEIGLGIAFLQSHYLKRIVIPATAFLLIGFCIHLTIEIVTKGANSGNCGCFGQLIPMTPLQALVKNIITLGMLGYMYVIYREKDRNNGLVLVILLLVVNLGVFMLYPFCPCKAEKSDISAEAALVVEEDSVWVNPKYIQPADSTVFETTGQTTTPVPTAVPPVSGVVTTKEKAKDTTTAKVVQTAPKTDASCPVRQTSVYAPFKVYNDGITANLDNGRKIVTLFSLDCEHCMETAKKIGELSKKRSIPPVYYLFWGSEDQVENFFKVAQYRFPYKIIDPSTFFQLLGAAPSPPKVTVLCNGNVLADFDTNTFSTEKLEEAIDK